MLRFLCVFMLLAGMASAQSYPEYQSSTVNDVADLLDPPEEAALSERLTELERETGVEMTVLTLSSQSGFAPDQTLEQFATGLFNHWGIGKAERDDGVDEHGEVRAAADALDRIIRIGVCFCMVHRRGRRQVATC